MSRLFTLIRAFHREESGHAVVALLSLGAAVGAVVLAIGAASDSDVTTIIGGGVLGVGVLGASVARHMGIDYGIYARLDIIEKK